MEIIKITTHIGTDGILKLEMPVDAANVVVDVVVVYAIQPKPTENWETFVKRTYGSLADDPIERPTELSHDVRDEV